MPYPINFDFAQKWNSEVVPHLDNSKIKSAIKKGINNYLSIFPTDQKYKPNTVPANYSSYDSYMQIIDKKWKSIYPCLKKNKMVPKNILQLEKKISNCDDDMIDDYGYELLCLEIKYRTDFFIWDIY